jgi:DNA-damage-inducible protein D
VTQLALPERGSPSGSPFDQIMEIDHDGTQIWRARRLMTLMGYPRWGDFRKVVERAMASARNTGYIVEEVFRRSPENPSEQGGRPREDFKLTREAAYLTALNGDPNKGEVALAQAYFVTRTREAETAALAIPSPAVAVNDIAIMRGLLDILEAERHRIAAVEATQAQQSERQREIEARMDGIEGMHDWFAALAYAKMNGLVTERSYLQRLGTAAGRITRRENLEPKKAQHALYGTVNTYPLFALDEAAELLAAKG